MGENHQREKGRQDALELMKMVRTMWAATITPGMGFEGQVRSKDPNWRAKKGMSRTTAVEISHCILFFFLSHSMRRCR